MIEFLSLLIQPEVQQYLIDHKHDDERDLILRKKEILGIPTSIIASQLIGRGKAKNKLPSWYKARGIIYPPSINLEQCSSEATASYKLYIIKNLIGESQLLAVDLTGGFGVDSFFLSKAFNTVHYVEPNDELLKIAEHNHLILGVNNITYQHKTAEAFLETTQEKFSFAFIDPSRRDDLRKVFKLSDCVPDIVSIQDKILSLSSHLLIKASPLLDIHQALRELNHVKKVFIVSVGNECKELLFLAVQSYLGKVEIEAVDLNSQGDLKSSFVFSLDEEKEADSPKSKPLKFLYEPNASILKAGAFKLVSKKYAVGKLSANTHLYTSGNLIADFPGKVLQIEELNPDSKKIKSVLPGGLANVITRNYPLKAEQLKKKFNLKDGGDKYLIGFSSDKKKFLAVCSRIK